ncbi:hypothetical protein LMTR3_20275 [Bradyrhizobium sp. LMTR 3]|nr:hypothetical protein LMTR3_20275 [Bradyrhizobium sp. LMTR 3]
MESFQMDANPAILSCALVAIARADDVIAKPMTGSTAAINSISLGFMVDGDLLGSFGMKRQ